MLDLPPSLLAVLSAASVPGPTDGASEDASGDSARGATGDSSHAAPGCGGDGLAGTEHGRGAEIAAPTAAFGPVAPGDVRAERVDLGLSGASVHRLLDEGGATVAYVKHAAATAAHLEEELRAEAERLTWLAEEGVRVPEVLGLVVQDGTWLATRALDGSPASDARDEHERVEAVTRAAYELRALHTLRPRSRRFDRSLPVALEIAERRTRAGLVDLSWRRAGRTGPDAAETLRRLRPDVAAAGPGRSAICHGDFCLPNLLVLTGGGAGFVDVGRAGLADPHGDVADMLSSIRSDLNPAYDEHHAQLFLDAYGTDDVDPERLALHDRMSEFFWPTPLDG